MGKITRREFVGNRHWLCLLWLLVVTIPFAILYLLESTVTIEHEIEDPEKFMEAFRKGKIGLRSCD